MLSKIKNIFNYFNSSCSPDLLYDEELINTMNDIENEEEEQNQAIIEFIIDKEGNIDLNIKWDNTSDELAENLGLLISNLNNGYFKNYTNKLLIEMANTGPDNIRFIKRCMTKIGEEQSKEFLVKPSEVFKLSSQERQL